MAQGVYHGGGGILPGECAERLSWTYFKKTSLMLLVKRSQSIGESHRMTEVSDPVLRVRCIIIGDRGASQVGHPGDLGRVELDPS